jgi:acyl carrier protein phosphodiesterase
VNWLAHVALAPSTADGWLGAILGDFVKGDPAATGWPAAVVDAIRQHRAIDSWTDAHPEVRAAKARFPEGTRRFAGVVLDLLFDHYLARDWARRLPHAGPLAAFTADVNAALAGAALPGLPERFVRLRPHLVREDWLASYAAASGWRDAGERMALRLRDPAAMHACLDVAQAIDAPLLDHFERFWPALATHPQLASARSAAAGDKLRQVARGLRP